MIDWKTEYYLNIGNTDNKNGNYRVAVIFCRSGNRQYSCIVLKYKVYVHQAIKLGYRRCLPGSVLLAEYTYTNIF